MAAPSEPGPCRQCPLCDGNPQPHSHFDHDWWQGLRAAAVSRAEEAAADIETADLHIALIGLQLRRGGFR